MRHLPRIISLLCGRQAEKDLIRAVFQSVVTTPPTTFGSVSTNMPRVRQSELLTPVELLVLIHLSEREIGIKQSIEAIGICFSMTEAFRPEVLGAFMQQIVDETTLPTLFLRTVSSSSLKAPFVGRVGQEGREGGLAILVTKSGNADNPFFGHLHSVRTACVSIAAAAPLPTRTTIHLFIQCARPRPNCHPPGHPSRHYVQIAPALCLQHVAIPTDHKEDLDDAPALAGIHPVR